MQKIYLCRHGETDWSKSGRHTSFTDLELTKNGEKQANCLYRRIKDMSFDHVMISPLQRARQTAELVQLKGEIEPDLFEWKYGEYEGLTTDQIQKLEPHWNVFTHGAKGGESPKEVTQRADRLIKKIRKLNGHIALFSSGHFTRAFAARWIGAPINMGQYLALSTASLSILGYEHDYPVIECWNDISHYLKLGETHGKRAA
ncbi:MAG: histidine phosphatase family protein [Rhabdochlamydiaceae bacterium]|nr:histidine phosphatase family protein [Candidatus Amphrikana amoebophyrae]